MARSGSDAAGGLVGWLVFGIGFAVYACTASPALGWLDSPELVAAAAGLGVAHSPGHPLPAFLGHLASLVPIGDIVLRVNLASALTGAAALAMLHRAGRDLLARVAPALGPRSRSVMAAAVALVVGTSWAAWSSAVRAEVYALQLLLSAGILVAVLAYDRAPRLRPLAVAGLLGGLALANHHLMALLVIVPAAVAIFARANRPGARAAAVTAMLGVVGLAAFLYLPVRAATYPESNFGNPSSLSRLIWTVSGAAFARSASTDHVSPPALDAVEVVAAVGEAATVPLFLLALFGLYLGVRRPGWRRLALLLAGVAAITAAARVVLGFDPETPDHHAYLVPAVVAVALLGLAGLGAVGHLVARAQPSRRSAGPIAAAALVLLVAVQIASQTRRASLHGAWASDDLARWELSSLPPRTLLLTAYFQTSFRVEALRAVEGARPDLAILDRSFLTYPGMVDDALHRHPELADLIRAPLRAGEPTPLEALGQVARHRPVFAQLHPNVDATLARVLIPDGAFARLDFLASAGPNLEHLDRDLRERERLALLLDAAVPGERDQAQAALLWHDVTRLDQYCQLGDRDAAAEVARDALTVAPEDATLAAMIDACLPDFIRP